MAPWTDRSAVSLLAWAVAATTTGGIAGGARVIAAVVVGHGLFLSMLGGEGAYAAMTEGFEILYSSNDDQGHRRSISMP